MASKAIAIADRSHYWPSFGFYNPKDTDCIGDLSSLRLEEECWRPNFMSPLRSVMVFCFYDSMRGSGEILFLRHEEALWFSSSLISKRAKKPEV